MAIDPSVRRFALEECRRVRRVVQLGSPSHDDSLSVYRHRMTAHLVLALLDGPRPSRRSRTPGSVALDCDEASRLSRPSRDTIWPLVLASPAPVSSKPAGAAPPFGAHLLITLRVRHPCITPTPSISEYSAGREHAPTLGRLGKGNGSPEVDARSSKGSSRIKIRSPGTSIGGPTGVENYMRRGHVVRSKAIAQYLADEDSPSLNLGCGFNPNFGMAQLRPDIGRRVRRSQPAPSLRPQLPRVRVLRAPNRALPREGEPAPSV